MRLRRLSSILLGLLIFGLVESVFVKTGLPIRYLGFALACFCVGYFSKQGLIDSLILVGLINLLILTFMVIMQRVAVGHFYRVKDYITFFLQLPAISLAIGFSSAYIGQIVRNKGQRKGDRLN